MPLDFYIQNKDTGFNYNESIQPVENGEDANQTTFRRPSENVRTRSEDIRKQFDLLEAVVSSDRGLTVMAETDAYVDWDSGTGKFDVTDSPSGGGAARNFYIVPLLSTAQGPSGAPPGVHLPATFVYNDALGGGGVFVTEAHPTLRDHGDSGLSRRSGANNLYMAVVESARTTGGVIIEVTGDEAVGPTFPADGPVLITVEMEQGGNTAAEIVAALQAAGDHDTYINTNALKTKVLAAGDCTKEVSRRRFADGDYYDAGGGTVYRSMGAIDPEGIKIDNATLGTFFATAGNELDEGDVLVVNFTGADDRLNNQTDTSMTDMLQKVSYLSGAPWEKLDSGHVARKHTVPVCKVFDGNLYFLNGTVFESGKPGRLIPDPGDIVELKAEYDAHVAGTADKHADQDITAEEHDGTGNPPVTTLPSTLPASSTVRAHINDLCQMVNRHMDATVANFKHPDTDVTAVARSDNPRSLTVGSTGAQLVELLGHYNHHVNAGDGPLDKHAEGHVTAASKAMVKFTLSGTDVGAQLGELATALDDHIDGTNSSFKHPYKDLTTRPIYIVDKAGNGHFDEINDALNDTTIKGNGGLIVVKVGDYTEDISIPAHDGAITVIGEGMTPVAVSGGVKFTGSITVAGGQTAPTIFKNIEFTQDASGLFLSTSGVYSESQMGHIVFEDCVFVRAVTDTGDFISSSVSMHFLRCHFQGNSYNYDVTCLQFYRDSGSSADYNSFTVRGCRFVHYYQLVHVSDSVSATEDLGHFTFTGNFIDTCGYAQASGASVLLYLEDCNFVVEGNIWQLDASTPAASGQFAYCSGVCAGSISYNKLRQGVRVSPSSAASGQYVISSIVASTGGAVQISGNYIACQYGGGIYANDGTTVVGNTISDFSPDEDDQSMLAGSARFMGNTLLGGAITGSGVAIIELFSDAKFIGNHIGFLNKSDVTIIKLATTSSAGRIIIANNSITIIDALYGIHINATGLGTFTDVAITGNTMTGVRNGVYITGASSSAVHHISVANNVISCNASAAYGIYCNCDDTYVQYVALIGNILHSENGTGDVGIYIADDTGATTERVAIGSNLFDGSFATPYTVPSGGQCGMRNEADDAYTMTQNWWPDYV